jgi:hypothetical protein
MQNFVNIKGIRIRKTSIKKYSPQGETKINIYYNTSRYKIDLEIIDVKNKVARDEILEVMDAIM